MGSLKSIMALSPSDNHIKTVSEPGKKPMAEIKYQLEISTGLLYEFQEILFSSDEKSAPVMEQFSLFPYIQGNRLYFRVRLDWKYIVKETKTDQKTIFAGTNM